MRGNPATMGKQALAGGVNLAKDKLRGALFGNPDTIGDNNPGPVAAEYNTSEKNKNYSSTSKILRDSETDITAFEGTSLVSRHLDGGESPVKAETATNPAPLSSF